MHRNDPRLHPPPLPPIPLPALDDELAELQNTWSSPPPPEAATASVASTARSGAQRRISVAVGLPGGGVNHGFLRYISIIAAMAQAITHAQR